MIGTLLIISLYYANSFLEQIQKISVTLCFHLCVRHKAQGRTVDAVAHAIGGLRIAGDDIHIDALFKLIPELACERVLCAALLRNTVLLRRQPVPDISEGWPVISFSSVFCGIFFCPEAQPLSSSTEVSRSGNTLRYMVYPSFRRR